MSATAKRNAELAKIHIAAKALGMDTHDKDPASDYRTMLTTVANVQSASDLDDAGRAKVLDHMRRMGFKSKRPERPLSAPRNASADRDPMLQKIRLQLQSAGREWAYVNGMAKRMFRIDDISFCTPDQLHKIVAALNIDARRRARKA